MKHGFWKFRLKKVAASLMSIVMLMGMLPSVLYGEEAQEDTLAPLCKSCILMEVSTGGILYERNADERLSPASITKIMTLLLIFDALDNGSISLQDEVVTSAYAQSMTGSKVFLEEGEVQTVETLIKCIVIASGNDASVVMAEHLAGSEAEFVKKMNARAKEIGLENTYFEDCCGLSDSDGHYSSARDVAVMSRELLQKYPQITKYTTIWMENMTHVTRRGSSEFGLTNTNKLLKQYPWTTGLKTGSTSKAGYCLSATAEKEGIGLIAVVMAAPDYKTRVSYAKNLLEYGYQNCNLYRDIKREVLPEIEVESGVKKTVKTGYAGEFSYLCTNPEDTVQKKIEMKKNLQAPVKKGDVAGKVCYYLGEREVGQVEIVTLEGAEKESYGYCLKKVIQKLWLS